MAKVPPPNWSARAKAAENELGGAKSEIITLKDDLNKEQTAHEETKAALRGTQQLHTEAIADKNKAQVEILKLDAAVMKTAEELQAVLAALDTKVERKAATIVAVIAFVVGIAVTLIVQWVL